MLKLLKNTPTITSSANYYAKQLNAILEEDDVKTIAINGDDGTGKSGVVKAFISNLSNDKYKIISLLDFRDNSGEAEQAKDIRSRLQLEISKQLIMTEQPGALKRTRLLWTPDYVHSGISGAAAVIVAIFVFTKIHPQVETIFDAFQVEELSEAILQFFVAQTTISLFSAFLSFAIASIVGAMIFDFLKFLLPRIRLSKVSAGGLQVDVSKGELSFDENLEELINFFESTNYKYIIFEDIDRFNNIKVYEDLRHLNILINQAISRRIIFIFAMKDGLIPNPEQRAKLFDASLPIVPFLSQENSKENIIKSLEEVNITSVNDDLLSFISRYMVDKREINNFANLAHQYLQFKSDNNWLNSNKLIAIAFLRNKFPSIYDDTRRGEGVLVEAHNECQKMKNAELTTISEDVTKRERALSILHENSSKTLNTLLNVASKKLNNLANHYIQLFIDNKPINESTLEDANFWLLLCSGTQIIAKRVGFSSPNANLSYDDIKSTIPKEIASLVPLLPKDEKYYHDKYAITSSKSAWNFFTEDIWKNLASNKTLDESERAILFTELSGLIAHSAFEDDFRLYIAPASTMQKNDKGMIEFIYNNLEQRIPNFSLEMGKASVKKILKSKIELDYANPAFLNIPFVEYIDKEKTQVKSLERFFELQIKENLNTTLDFYAYCMFHMRNIDGLDEDNDQRDYELYEKVTRILIELCPSEFIEKFLDSNLLYNPFEPEKIVGSIILDAINKKPELATERVKKFFAKNLPAFEEVIDYQDMIIEIMDKHNILVNDIPKNTKGNEKFRKTIIERGLFIINKINLQQIRTNQEAFISALGRQPDRIANIVEDLSKMSNLTKTIVGALLNWLVRENADSMKENSRTLAEILAKKEINLSKSELEMLNADKIEEKNWLTMCAKSRELSENTKAFVTMISKPERSSFRKLASPRRNRRISIPNIEPYLSVCVRLEAAKRIKITSKNTEIHATVQIANENK